MQVKFPKVGSFEGESDRNSSKESHFRVVYL